MFGGMLTSVWSEAAISSDIGPSIVPMLYWEKWAPAKEAAKHAPNRPEHESGDILNLLIPGVRKIVEDILTAMEKEKRAMTDAEFDVMEDAIFGNDLQNTIFSETCNRAIDWPCVDWGIDSSPCTDVSKTGWGDHRHAMSGFKAHMVRAVSVRLSVLVRACDMFWLAYPATYFAVLRSLGYCLAPLGGLLGPLGSLLRASWRRVLGQKVWHFERVSKCHIPGVIPP